MNQETICILGGSGFVGSHLAHRLTRDGYRVHILTRRPQWHRALAVNPNITLVGADVQDSTVLRRQFAGCAAIINLVGILNETGKREAGFRQAHVELPQRVADAAVASGVDRLLHMSALNADACERDSLYLKTKGEGEDRVHAAAEHGLVVTSFRPSVIFGPGDSFFNRFASLLRIAGPVFPLACPNSRFAPVCVMDVAEAMCRALDKATGGERLELCGPGSYTLRELVEYTRDQLGLRCLVVGHAPRQAVQHGQLLFPAERQRLQPQCPAHARDQSRPDHGRGAGLSRRQEFPRPLPDSAPAGAARLAGSGLPANPMHVYLVGGAVRDRLLGLPVRERDWVVVGATPQEMLALGYTPVGRDFPVFLHPETKEEYALARTERKTGPGYTGFAVHAEPDVTLEEDLLRRDLTINAMAETPDGELIDPYGGKDDLDNGILRHVSPAFAEDPVRILRIARFAARFSRWGFHVAHDTNKLLRSMVASGEVDQLVPERVWAELVKALAEPVPVRFFEVLHGCGALARLLPELEPLYPAAGHTAKAPGHATLPVLQAAVGLSEATAVRWAALVCDIDNADPHKLDKPRLNALCERLRTPNACRELALLALQYRRQVHEIAGLSPAAVLDLLTAVDALRRADRLDAFLLVCEADARSRDGGLLDYLPARLVLQARQACLQVKAPPGKHGPEIAAIMRARRVEAIKRMLA